MKRFLLLYKGPPTRPEASHEGWPEWFRAIGDALVDLGSPMVNGVFLHADGSTSYDAAGVNGYSVIQAEGRSEGLDLLRDHPLLALGGEHAIAVFEVPKRLVSQCQRGGRNEGEQHLRVHLLRGRSRENGRVL